MYTQFFGNFLLSRGVVTSEQLINAIKEESTTHIKLGTLAIHAGYMTASEADNIIIMQTNSIPIHTSELPKIFLNKIYKFFVVTIIMRLSSTINELIIYDFI